MSHADSRISSTVDISGRKLIGSALHGRGGRTHGGHSLTSKRLVYHKGSHVINCVLVKLELMDEAIIQFGGCSFHGTEVLYVTVKAELAMGLRMDT